MEAPCSGEWLPFSDVQFPELEFGHLGGGIRHQAHRLLGFGKSDHLAEGIGPGKNHHQAVKPEGQASVGRGPVLQGLQQKPEFFLRRFRADAQQLEHLALGFLPVNSNRAAADLHSIEDDIVSLGPDLPGVGFEFFQIFIPG